MKFLRELYPISTEQWKRYEEQQCSRCILPLADYSSSILLTYLCNCLYKQGALPPGFSNSTYPFLFSSHAGNLG